MATGDSLHGKMPLLEWFWGFTGLILILGIFAVIGREAIREQLADAPAIAVRVDVISPADASYVVAFEALNQASGTAVAVEIEGRWISMSSLVEQSGATTDYVPAMGGPADDFVIKDPHKHWLIIRATGFQNT